MNVKRRVAQSISGGQTNIFQVLPWFSSWQRKKKKGKPFHMSQDGFVMHRDDNIKWYINEVLMNRVLTTCATTALDCTSLPGRTSNLFSVVSFDRSLVASLKRLWDVKWWAEFGTICRRRSVVNTSSPGSYSFTESLGVIWPQGVKRLTEDWTRPRLMKWWGGGGGEGASWMHSSDESRDWKNG